MSGGMGRSRQVITGAIGSSAQKQRGGWKAEQMLRSDQEQRVNRNGGVRGCGWEIGGVGRSGWASRQVSRCSGWMQRGKRKDDWM